MKNYILISSAKRTQSKRKNLSLLTNDLGCARPGTMYNYSNFKFSFVYKVSHQKSKPSAIINSCGISWLGNVGGTNKDERKPSQKLVLPRAPSSFLSHSFHLLSYSYSTHLLLFSLPCPRQTPLPPWRH